MYNDTITELDLLESVRSAVAEMVEWRDSDNADDYGDDITEQADGLVNVYYTGAIHEWTVAGYPDAEELGGEYPEHRLGIESTLERIAREAQVAMFYWYHAEIVKELDKVLEARNNEKENN